MKTLDQLKVRIFADGADKKDMMEVYQLPYLRGFTTNPTLMRKAGITNYEAFAREILSVIPDRSISFEVFADDSEMERQARRIALWGKNVSVKIPITNTKRERAIPLIRKLSHDGIALNVTAIFTLDQVQDVVDAVKDGGAPCFVSVFAGRIADTGRDPVPLMAEAVQCLKQAPNTELIWASPRELLNVFQADDIGCHVITVTNDILKKLTLIGKDLSEYSLDTVKMFYTDGQAANYQL